MRILVMTDTPPNPDSGAAGTEFQTIAALRELGHEVDAVWADDLGRRIDHGNLHYLLELPMAYRASMVAHLRNRSYDVVHASQPHGWLAARTARRMPGGPVFIHRSHGLEPRVASNLSQWRHLDHKRPARKQALSSALSTLLKVNDRAVARYAHGHIVSSRLCGLFLQEQMHVPSERIAVIAQAAPAMFVEQTPSEWSSERLDRMLYVGQFAFVKAPMILARAFELVLAANPQATLTWVCSEQHHAQARALLNESARAKVQLLDWMPQAQLMQIYDTHGIFLFPSFFEGFGKAFLEALARGLVVVASDEGGAHDLIDNGINGFKVPVGDPQALAQACLAVQRGQYEVKSLSAAARASAITHTWQRVGVETAAFYQRLRDMQ